MTTLALASVKGSPGVTTAALALASWWPNPVVIVEADPAGGDLAARLGLPEEPGLVGLAASLRRNSRGRSPDAASVESYLQAAPVQTASEPAMLLTAPAGGRQATAALSLLSEHPPLPMPGGADLLLDLGRRVPTDPVDQSAPLPLMDPGDRIIWISRPQLADLAHLAAAVDHRRRTNPPPLVILNGSGPYPAAEVATALGVAILGTLPTDPSGAAALWAGGGRSWAHSALGRAARDLAVTLADLVAGEPGDDTEEKDAAAPGDLQPGEIVGQEQRVGTAPSGSHS
jgi:hypothetical protein